MKEERHREFSRHRGHREYKRSENKGCSNAFSTVFAWLFVIGLVIWFIDSLPANIAAIILIVILIIGISSLIGKIKNIKKKKRYRKYINIVVHNGETSLDRIALLMFISYEQVVKDLQEMIENGDIEHMVIDHDNRELVYPGNNTEHVIKVVITKEDSREEPEEKEPEAVVVICKGCGAKNAVLTGRISECEYCGSLLTEE